MFRRIIGWMRGRGLELARFLYLPLAVVAGFVALAIAMYGLDARLSRGIVHASGILGWLNHLFGDRQATRDLLGTAASGLITVASITFSLLLLAVQQGASAYGNQVFDQFMRRPGNRLSFGFFIGATVYCLICLVTLRGTHFPVLAAPVAVAVTAAALCTIIVLIYTTLDQMRAGEVIGALRELTRKARRRQLAQIAGTRPGPSRDDPPRAEVRSDAGGYLAALHGKRLRAAVRRCAPEGEVEVSLALQIGDFVAAGDLLAVIRCGRPVPDAALEAIRKAALDALEVRRAREIEQDPRLGLSELATIGWTDASSARSNPQPVAEVCRALRELIGEWGSAQARGDAASPIVYQDRLVEEALAVLEDLAVAAAESKQQQTLSEVLLTQAAILPRLPAPLRVRLSAGVGRSLATLPRHEPTLRLTQALEALADALAACGLAKPARQVRAGARLGASPSCGSDGT